MQTGSQGNKARTAGGAAACEHVRIYSAHKIELVDCLVHIGCNCKLEEGSLFYSVRLRTATKWPLVVSAVWSLPAAACVR
jgi:hypothetical protein